MSRSLAPLLAFVCLCTPAFAQGVVGGVFVDPDGMVRESASLSQDERLKELGQSLIAAAPREFAVHAGLRTVSLNRLEQALSDARKEGRPLPPELQCLAGLQRIDLIAFDADERDVLLAGPAEAWKQLPSGELVGERSGRPVLRLEDLVVCLRFAFDPSAGFLGCSIDPTEAGMKAHAAYLRNVGRIDASRVREIGNGLAQAMGPQDVRLFGVPEASRTALMLLAADYRLKRISMGHDPAPIRKFQSYLDLAARSTRIQQHRFWFVGRFDAIRHTPDEQTWALEGTGVQVATAPTTAANAPDARPSKVATLYVDSFTKQFPEIAAAVPVFQELQNFVAIATVAGIVERRSRADANSWKPSELLDTDLAPNGTRVPKQVPSLANVRQVRDRSWMFSVSGGVEISIAGLLDPERVKLADEKLAAVRARATEKRTDRWWWDAAP